MENKVENRFIVPCLFGLEGIVADELRELSAEGFAEFTDIAAHNGRAEFSGGLREAAAANIRLRCGERVLLVLARGRVETFEDLFQLAKSCPLEEWTGRDDAFPVKGYSLKSKLHSVPDCQSIVKKALVERMKQKYRVEWFRETGPKRQIQFGIMDDEAYIALDTSGAGLHKRGYRAEANEAPLRETLAAAIVKLARYESDKILMDPMCGSGTLLIEAAMIASGTAPGLRRAFSAEEWSGAPASAFRETKARAAEIARTAELCIIGSDIDEKAVALTMQNARKAGVERHIRCRRASISELDPASAGLTGKGTIVCNPPYGERMLAIGEAERLYAEMGKIFSRFLPWHLYILTPDEGFESFFGMKADKKRRLYNGMIQCQLYQYFKNTKTAENNSLKKSNLSINRNNARYSEISGD